MRKVLSFLYVLLIAFGWIGICSAMGQEISEGADSQTLTETTVSESAAEPVIPETDTSDTETGEANTETADSAGDPVSGADAGIVTGDPDAPDARVIIPDDNPVEETAGTESEIIPKVDETLTEGPKVNTDTDNKNDVEQLIEYNEITKANKYNFQFKLTIFFYVLSILAFLFYLRFEYDPNIEVNYFIRLLIISVASIFVIIGNKIYSNNYVEKIEDKKKVSKLSHVIVFIYYVILLFNMVVFARYNSIDSYNLVPFKSIIDIFKNGTTYSIIINIFGNLLVFMPLEYFLIELFKVKKFYINFILSFGIILLIELFQYVFKVGVLDIDDLILCTFGMMIFYIIYNKVVIKWQKEKRKN